MPGIGLNLVPIGLLSLGFIIGLSIGLAKQPKKKWNWLWFGLIGMAAGLLLKSLHGLIDHLITR